MRNTLYSALLASTSRGRSCTRKLPVLKPIKLQEREAQVSGLIRENNSGLKDEEEKLLLVNNSTAPLSKKYSLIYIPRVGGYTDMASVH
ncbi:hypothetical protein NQZ68_040338 [Dissostichus eleginoides]|nr:hypothetical protein NQZ68_040338 [Dissostichus eleginoides]